MASLLDILSQSSILLIITGLLVGAAIGSFLNVVIYRLPLILYKDWQMQCRDLQQHPIIEQLPKTPLSLASPGSTCPLCNTKIAAHHNIPLISYLLLGRRCRHCNGKISSRYFIVELLSALLSIYILVNHGLSLVTLFSLTFTFLLLPLIFIDIDHKLLPDHITYLLLWSGVIYSLSGHGIALQSAITGVLVGYLSLWSVYIVFKLITGKEGMGHGDFKLLAALGAWVGWQHILMVILLSSLSGTLIGLVLIACHKNTQQQNQTIPFGPFLAISGWITYFFGPTIKLWYLSIL